jgi:hypothetical protein
MCLEHSTTRKLRTERRRRLYQTSMQSNTQAGTSGRAVPSCAENPRSIHDINGVMQDHLWSCRIFRQLQFTRSTIPNPDTGCHCPVHTIFRSTGSLTDSGECIGTTCARGLWCWLMSRKSGKRRVSTRCKGLKQPSFFSRANCSVNCLESTWIVTPLS